MIRIDALYLLLLIELSVLLAGGIIFFLIRSRKYRALYQQSMKDLGEARQVQEDLRKRLSASRRSADAQHMPPAPAAQKSKSVPPGGTGELDALRAQLNASTEELKTKTGMLEQLQAKFADLEKEYLILYHQQQKQQR